MQSNPSWQDDAIKPRLVRRIESELDVIEAYLAARVGSTSTPGPLGGGADPTSPAHLDLHDIGRTHTNTSVNRARTNSKRYLSFRRQRTRAIVWRAAALHDEVWTASADRTSATLAEIQGGPPSGHVPLVIDELVDRRLRVVERMSFQVSKYTILGGRRWRKPLTGQTGPWRDRFRVRPFEYPRLVKETEPFGQLVAAIGPDNISPAEYAFQVPPGHTTVPPWRYSANGRRLEYNVRPWPGLHFPERLANDFFESRGPDSYIFGMRTRAGRTASAVVDDLFMEGLPDEQRENFWQRTWLFCDTCISALQIESLRFALKRRTGNDEEFDRLQTERPEGYIALSYFAGLDDVDLLMADTDDPYFENLRDRRAPDLQVGDHVIFWNSYLYGAATLGDWTNEYSLIMDIDSDPETGGIRLSGLRLQGHGLPEKNYRSFQEQLKDHVVDALGDAWRVVAAVGTDPARPRIRYAGMDARFVRWSPYEDFAAPGAWWIQVPRTYTSFDEVAAMPQVVHDLPSDQQGPGYQNAPFPDSVYFPLFVPRIAGGWRGYLERRRTDLTLRPPKLQRVDVDLSIVPGIFERGEDQPIHLVRPRVRR
jgi:hypothetical protein